MGRSRRQPTAAEHARFNEAQRKEAIGDTAGAREIYRALARKHAKDPAIHYAVAQASIRLCEYDDALWHLDRAIQRDLRNAKLHATRAGVLAALSRVRDGLKAADRALAIDPSQPLALHFKAELLTIDGRAREAYELLAPRLPEVVDAPGLVAVFAESAAAIGRPDEALHAIEPLVGDNGIPPRQRSPLLFCLGAIRDRQGEYDAAFEAFAAANRLYPATFDAESHARRIQERIDAWTPERTAGLPRASNADETPVFIIGMPRSGTTLVEQIIATHPEAFGAGERWAIPSLEREFFDARQRGASEADCLDLISRGALDRAATRELRALKRLAPSAGRITDKMMTNFLHLGLVQLVFPGARVVHCRRDPLDTCLSCFFHRFPEGSEPYAYDLEHLAEYRRTYLEITEHWKSVLDLPWLDVTYKDLVADPDAQIPRLIEFLGLAWDDACLRFHESDREVATLSAEQVRRPMYRTSVGRYRHYEKHLGPLKRALGLD